MDRTCLSVCVDCSPRRRDHLRVVQTSPVLSCAVYDLATASQHALRRFVSCRAWQLIHKAFWKNTEAVRRRCLARAHEIGLHQAIIGCWIVSHVEVCGSDVAVTVWQVDSIQCTLRRTTRLCLYTLVYGSLGVSSLGEAKKEKS
ncbi:hypothetical protein J6590_051812 [Homalodisca vitripennis]|nr:hypothetical protein J6590_051812 [Homalodisca vitripennis]